jgi:hypothetical protein
MARFTYVSIDDLNIKDEIKQILKNNEIFNVKKLITYSRSYLLHIRGLGETSLDQIEFAISQYGASLPKYDIPSTNTHLCEKCIKANNTCIIPRKGLVVSKCLDFIESLTKIKNLALSVSLYGDKEIGYQFTFNTNKSTKENLEEFIKTIRNNLKA